jgi:hypothetical protein
MPSEGVSDRLKALVLELSYNPDELYRYSQNPGAYLRARDFSEEVIEAILAGCRPLQQLLAREGGRPSNVFCVQGVESYFSLRDRRGAEKKAAKKTSAKKK